MSSALLYQEMWQANGSSGSAAPQGFKMENINKTKPQPHPAQTCGGVALLRGRPREKREYSIDYHIVVRSGKMKLTVSIKNPYTLGQVIQQSRLQQGFSQRELAKMLGVSQRWVWEMEQGKQGLLMERLSMVLEKTGVALSAEFEAKDGCS